MCACLCPSLYIFNSGVTCVSGVAHLAVRSGHESAAHAEAALLQSPGPGSSLLAPGVYLTHMVAVHSQGAASFSNVCLSAGRVRCAKRPHLSKATPLTSFLQLIPRHVISLDLFVVGGAPDKPGTQSSLITMCARVCARVCVCVCV
jgi:hypothetical protein